MSRRLGTSGWGLERAGGVEMDIMTWVGEAGGTEGKKEQQESGFHVPSSPHPFGQEPDFTVRA